MKQHKQTSKELTVLRVTYYRGNRLDVWRTTKSHLRYWWYMRRPYQVAYMRYFIVNMEAPKLP